MRSVAWTPRRDERHGTCAIKACSERVACGRCGPDTDRGADNDEVGRSGATLSGWRAAGKERSGFAVNSSPPPGGAAPSPRSSSSVASPRCWPAWCAAAGGSAMDASGREAGSPWRGEGK